ncbi:hypothetical protein SAMN04489797_2925 [Winogradskyella sediminis]|uniref:Uncharacterized protein n=1 Tax=Winogradskyella sediminis TaxID=1382466 RepID=A0A1H1WPQ6_9FLAO|nr:hypothetical protein SAMN04489797_2925 [Winogradskyella sediminis]
MEKKDDYPVIFYIMRIVNIFSLIIFNFFMIIGVSYIASYFLLLFYLWLLFALSVVEIGYVIRGDRELFIAYKKTNIFFISFYFISIMNVIYHYIF